LSILKWSTMRSIPAVGETIPYELVVTNTGNVTVTALAVTDTNTAGVSCPASTLAPSAAITCTASHTVTQLDADAAQVANTATVAGTAPGGPIPPVQSNQVIVAAAPNPALTIVKSTTTTEAAGAGHVIAFTFVITNTGDVALHDIVVADPNVGAIGCPQATLAPGAMMTCTADHTTTLADVSFGRVVNNATVVGTTPDGVAIAPVSSNQVVVAILAGISPSPPSPTPLPATGGNVDWLVRLGALLTLMGAGLSVGAHRGSGRRQPRDG
jgi:uncharacterized repeat protein (TIGR01451 family)